MTEQTVAYRIVTRNHINKWSPELQQGVPGWEVKALWVSTGTILPVFVPDGSYTPDNVDHMIRVAGELDEKVHALGA